MAISNLAVSRFPWRFHTNIERMAAVTRWRARRGMPLLEWRRAWRPAVGGVRSLCRCAPSSCAALPSPQTRRSPANFKRWNCLFLLNYRHCKPASPIRAWFLFRTTTDDISGLRQTGTGITVASSRFISRNGGFRARSATCQPLFCADHWLPLPLPLTYIL